MVGFVSDMGYTGIIILMTMESSFLPVPSEIVMPPAGYLVSQGQMNPYIVVLCGTVGSVFGALINYAIAVFFGRAFLNRYGKYVLLNHHRLDQIEHFFNRHGEITTFTGRMLPAVRHVISFPAGLARMSLPRFVFFTALGSGIWAVVLMMVGYYIGNNLESIKQHMHIISAVTVVALGALIWIYIRIRRYLDAK